MHVVQNMNLNSIIYFTVLHQIGNIPPPPHSENIVTEDGEKIFSEDASGNTNIVSENV